MIKKAIKKVVEGHDLTEAESILTQHGKDLLKNFLNMGG